MDTQTRTANPLAVYFGGCRRATTRCASHNPPLIEKLSGVISEDDLKKLAREDERARFILRENR
ncbi:MAG: hypothetical protein Ta2A_18780 [Treponemataceae bacterium]|nr:MAG: hypothetical protein Ta2A_18780 [Treponemataceae bacterium]